MTEPMGMRIRNVSSSRDAKLPYAILLLIQEVLFTSTKHITHLGKELV